MNLFSYSINIELFIILLYKSGLISCKVIYEIISNGESEKVFHLTKWDIKTNVAIHVKYISVAGILNGPPTKISETRVLKNNCGKNDDMQSDAKTMPINKLAKNNLPDIL